MNLPWKMILFLAIAAGFGPLVARTPARSAEAALPEFYGVYLLIPALTELEAVPVATRAGLTIGDIATAVDGFEGDPSLAIKHPRPEIIVFLEDVRVADIHLAKLSFTTELQAYQFNTTGTPARFFENVYGTGYYDTVGIFLWQPAVELSLRAAPVAGHPEMLRLVPPESLEPGRYGVYVGNSVHGPNTVFTARFGRQSSAYWFALE